MRKNKKNIFLKFIKWMRKSNYTANFFMGISGGIAATLLLEVRGLKIFTSIQDFSLWSAYLSVLIIYFFIGAIIVYSFSDK